MNSPEATLSRKTEEPEAGLIRIQPFVTEETHRIIRIAAATQNVSHGKIIDGWAAKFQESENAA